MLEPPPRGSVRDGVAVLVDRDLRIVLADAPGLADDERTALAGATLASLFPAAARDQLAQHAREVLAGAQRSFALPCAAGEPPCRITLLPQRDHDGNVAGLLAVSWDASASASRDAAVEAERRYRLIAESSRDAVGLRGADGTYRYVSPSVTSLAGYLPEELVGRPAMDVVHPADAANVASELSRLHDGEDVVELEYRVRHRDGRWVWVETTASALRCDKGSVAEIRTSTRDITARRAHEAELRAVTAELELRLHETTAIAHLGEYALEEPDLARFLAEATRTVAETLGLPLCGLFGEDADGMPEIRAGVGWRPGLVGRSLRRGASAHDANGAASGDPTPPGAELAPDPRWEATLNEHGAMSAVSAPVGDRATSHMVLAAYASEPRVFTAGERAFLLAVANVVRDVIARRRAEDAVRHDALHDGLTGLPNRTLLTDRLTHALERAARDGERHAVIFLDVDHFKLVNDSLGHAVGDRLLQDIGRRLRSAVRPADTVARFGGDEFVVLCESVEGQAEAMCVADRLMDALRAPLDIGARHHVASASAGVTVTGDADRSADDVLRDADTAMYRAKAGGRAEVVLFDPVMRESALARLELEDELRRALAGDELRVAYQPILPIDSGHPAMVEALVRWQHPDRGLLAPGAFITVAEETGLIADLGRYVLRAACAQVARWRADVPGASELGLSVNVSARQLAHPGFFAEVSATLERTGMPAHALGLEITEGVLLSGGGATAETIAALRAHGVRLMLDDFGTGYSSLSYLRRFPLDVLKIDRSFVTNLHESIESRAIIEAITAMANALGIDVTVEGVETVEELQALREIGCASVQGYLLARPMFADDLERYLLAAGRST